MSKAEEAFSEFWEKNYQEIFPLVREYKFHETRRWRVDFCSLEHKLAIEINGFGWGHSGSTKSQQSDTEKHQQLAILGWTYFPILASDCTKRIDVAVLPLLKWINTHTPNKLSEPGKW